VRLMFGGAPCKLGQAAVSNHYLYSIFSPNAGAGPHGGAGGLEWGAGGLD